MIQVTYHRQYSRVSVKGHAGSGPEGHDLVCAGVSALTATLACNVAHMADQGAVREAITELKEGDALVQCTPRGRYRESVAQIYRAICVGFELLATKYPENISYEIVG